MLWRVQYCRNHTYFKWPLLRGAKENKKTMHDSTTSSSNQWPILRRYFFNFSSCLFVGLPMEAVVSTSSLSSPPLLENRFFLGKCHFLGKPGIFGEMGFCPLPIDIDLVFLHPASPPLSHSWGRLWICPLTFLSLVFFTLFCFVILAGVTPSTVSANYKTVGQPVKSNFSQSTPNIAVTNNSTTGTFLCQLFKC